MGPHETDSESEFRQGNRVSGDSQDEKSRRKADKRAEQGDPERQEVHPREVRAVRLREENIAKEFILSTDGHGS